MKEKTENSGSPSRLGLLLGAYNKAEGEQKALIGKKIASMIKHPLDVEAYLGFDAPLLKEAYVIADCFEAATIGMENAEAFEALDNLPEESLFSSWKELILALLALYQGDAPERDYRLGRIEPGSPLEPLKALLSGASSDNVKGGNAFLSGLYSLPNVLKEAHQLIDDTLELYDEELIRDSLEHLFFEIKSHSQDSVAPLAAYAARKTREIGVSPDWVLAPAEETLGRKEALKVMASSLTDTDPAKSLVYFLDYLELLLEGSRDKNEMAGVLWIVRELLSEVSLSSEEAFMAYLESRWGTLLFQLVPLFPALGESPDGLRSSLSAFFTGEAPNKRAPKRGSKVKAKEEPLQLELF